MMTGDAAYQRAKRYVKKTMAGAGAIKGDKGDPGTEGKSAYDIWLEEGNTGTEADFLESLKGSGGVTADDALDITSTNAIQNKVVAEKIEEIEGQLKDKSFYVYYGLGNLSVEEYKFDNKITSDMVGTTVPFIIVSQRYGESSGEVEVVAQVDENTFTISGGRNGNIKFGYEEAIKSNGINDSQTTSETTWSSLKIQNTIDNTIGDISGQLISNNTLADDKTWSSRQIDAAILDIIDDDSSTWNKTWSGLKIKEELGKSFDNLTEEQKASLKGEQGPIGPEGPQGPQGEKGADGTMTFEELTEEQKASLKGEQGETGATGAEGKSAYEIWLEAGNTGNEVDFLASLKGNTGETGPQGLQGPQGIEGPQGPPGEKGEKGDKGDQGVQGIPGTNGTNGTTPTIKAAAGSNINTVGTPSVTASTSGTTTTFTFNNLKGEKGDAGSNGTTPTIKAAAGSNINTVGTPSVTASTSGTTTTFTFNNLKGATGANGTTPTIKVASGSNIGSVGTPSVSASTSGTTTTFTFNYLKGAKGDKGDTGETGATGPAGYKRFPSTPGVTTTTGVICSLESKKVVVLYCIHSGGGSLAATSYVSGLTFNGSTWSSGTKAISVGNIYTIANTGSSTTTIKVDNNGGAGFLVFGPMS